MTRRNPARSSFLAVNLCCGCKFGKKIDMARWIYQRPIECCDQTELIVAKRLALLADGWVIRWGFYYDSDREGDFLILGPTGGVLVFEVKGGELRKLSTTGRWEGPDRDHPMAQLSAEWHATIARLQETADGNAVPFVAKALCLAGLTIDPKITAYREIDRSLIIDRGDLAAFETTWSRLFARRGHPAPEEERKVFSIRLPKTLSERDPTFRYRNRSDSPAANDRGVSGFGPASR